MKLKKILAVALAATTALSSGVAYDMLGASANTAEAAWSGSYQSVGETFTYTDSDANVTYTFKVTKPILNGVVKSSFGTDDVKASNGIYKNGAVQDAYTNSKLGTISATTAGFVTLTAVEIKNQDYTDVKIPLSVVSKSASGSGVNKANIDIAAQNDNAKGTYYVTAVDLDGENISYSEKIAALSVTSGNETQIESVKVQNFKNLTGIYKDDPTSNESANFTTADTIDVSGNEALTFAKASALYANDTKLETLDISSIKKNEDGTVTVGGPTQTGLKSVDISGNANITSLTANFAVPGTVNISDNTGLTNVTVTGPNVASAYDAPNMKGVKFITDGSNASYDLDMSFINKAEKITITNTGIRSFTAPGFNSDSTATNVLNVSNNALTTVSLSSASYAGSVDVSCNKLLEADISGLAKATSIKVNDNYLTSMDTSGLDDTVTRNVDMTNNFIPAANLTKSDKQTSISLGTQRSADLFRWAYAGEIGQASGSDSKALMKLGGTGTLIGAMVVQGAPQGFAEKLAATITWTEANSAETSAVALGDSAVVTATETAYNLAGVGQGYLSGVVVSTAVTANATKTAAEKVTLQYGNTKRDINISNDNIALVSYDIASAIESENTKEDNKYTLAYAQMLFPTEAFILNSQGTVDATLTSVKPLAEVSTTATDKATNSVISGDRTKHEFGDAVTEKLKVVEGMTFTKWNTAVDGSGTAVASGAKLKALEADTVVYANYTENTYSINFTSGQKSSDVTVTGSTATQSGLKYGDNVTLNSNGFSTSAGNYYGWLGSNSSETDYTKKVFYSDGQTVQGLAAKNKKTDTYKMEAFYGEANHYISTAESSISLVVGDAEEGAYKLADLKPVITGDPASNATRDGQSGVDLGYDKNIGTQTAANYAEAGTNGYFYVYSSDKDVVEIVQPKQTTTDATTLAALGATGSATLWGDAYAVGKGSGTATIYVRDEVYGNLAAVSVTVQSSEEAAASAAEKAKIAAANKAIEAGETTDVSDYSTYAAKVKKNADGENTVTIVEGKDKKTVKISTITIGDKVYTVTRIGTGAYKGSKKLTTLATGNNVKVIGKTAFANCSKLKKATLGTKVAKILAKAFANDKKLATVVINSKKLTTTKKVATTAFKNAGKSVKTTVKIKKTITAKVAKKEKKVFKKAGLKKYGKKTCTYKRGTKTI